MFYRKCRICGCSLDPSEGNMCEECRDEQYMKQQQEKAVRYTDFRQMEMEEFLNASN